MDPGAVLIVIVVVFVLPPLVLMGGAAASALIGWASKTYAEKRNPDSELIQTNF